MEFTWKHAGPIFAGLPSPDYGAPTRWYQESWTHLSSAGLTKVETPIDVTRIRLRIMTLCWMAHDFGGAYLADEEATVPYWSDWIEQLEIKPFWALITTVENRQIGDAFAETKIFQPDLVSEDDDDLLPDDDEISEDLNTQVVLFATHCQRETVVNALVKGFGDESLLFASMYANCCDLDRLIEQKQTELEDEIEELMEQLESESRTESADELKKQIEDLRKQLDRDKLATKLAEDLREGAINDAVYLGDTDSQQRLLGHQWCINGCPVLIRGEPTFYVR